LHEYFELPVESYAVGYTREPVQKPAIVFENVSFGYVSEQRILDNFNFEFCGPGLYGIMGPSGIGKSTIAKLVLNLYKPDSGSVVIYLDKSIANSLEEVRTNISYVAQSTELFNISIRENVLLGCKKEVSDAMLAAICERLNLHDKIERLVDGYDTVVSEKINLSGGEMQRLALARAYLKNAPITILDEVTSSLDDANSQSVMEVINEMKQKSIVILLTHRAAMLVRAKKVINL
jgi:ATP-binding cassette subfamily B protein